MKRLYYLLFVMLAATGIMQIMRRYWEDNFADGMPLPADTGYIRAGWDSLAWNWRISIMNGRFIHDIYMYNRIMRNQIQKTFPDSCPFSTCGSFPGKKNKEDLKTYGYTTNETMMNAIQNDTQWIAKIGTYPPPTDEAKYVQLVRGYTYEKPWNE